MELLPQLTQRAEVMKVHLWTADMTSNLLLFSGRRQK